MQIADARTKQRAAAVKRLAEMELAFLVYLHEIGGTDIAAGAINLESDLLNEAYTSMQHATCYAARHLFNEIEGTLNADT